MTFKTCLRSGLALSALSSLLAFGCSDSSPEGDDETTGTGGATGGNDGSGGSGTGGKATGGMNPGGAPGTGSMSGTGGAQGGMGGMEAEGPCIDRSGIETVDGFLQAVDDLEASALAQIAAFQDSVTKLEAEFGLEGTGNLNARVDALEAEFKAATASHTADGLWIYSTETECVSNAAAARGAQFACETALCDNPNSATAADVPMACEGSCLGACSGSCAAEAQALCRVEVTAAVCAGTCAGTCEATPPDDCKGICDGTCAGTCSASDESGCLGECSGSCDGVCELKSAGSCQGDCTGTCLTEVPGACSGDLVCDGECTGECDSRCAGAWEPGSALVACDRSADCQAQASAIGSANLTCTEVTVRHAFEYDGPGEDEAAFTQRMETFAAELKKVQDSYNVLRALVTGQVNGKVAFETAPVDGVINGMGGLLSAGTGGDLFSEATVAQIACAVALLGEGSARLADVLADSSPVLQAQASLIVTAESDYD